MFTTPVINVHGQSFKTTNVLKHLGVVLDSTLSFNDHLELRKALSKVLGVFSRARQASHWKLPIEFMQPWSCPPLIIVMSCGKSPVKEMIKWSSVYREKRRE